MTRKEVERIVGIFKNHGIDKETGKRVKENVIHDFLDEIEDMKELLKLYLYRKSMVLTKKQQFKKL